MRVRHLLDFSPRRYVGKYETAGTNGPSESFLIGNAVDSFSKLDRIIVGVVVYIKNWVWAFGRVEVALLAQIPDLIVAQLKTPPCLFRMTTAG